MTYQLDCDTCEFATTVELSVGAYSIAMQHESEQPTHFVMIYDYPGEKRESPRG